MEVGVEVGGLDGQQWIVSETKVDLEHAYLTRMGQPANVNVVCSLCEILPTVAGILGGALSVSGILAVTLGVLLNG